MNVVDNLRHRGGFDYPTSDVEESTNHLNIYVSATGDDENGIGSKSRPFATLARAYARVPRLLRHAVKINLDGTTFIGAPSCISPICEDGGSLAIVGMGAPVVSLELELVTVEQLGDEAGWLCTFESEDVTVDDQLVGSFVRCPVGKDGVDSAIYPIMASTATTLVVGYSSRNAPEAESVVEIVTPGTRLGSYEPIDLVVDNRCDTSDDVGAVCRLGLFNLAIDFQNCEAKRPMSVRGDGGAGGVALVLVSVTAANLADQALTVVDTSINGGPFQNADALDTAMAVNATDLPGSPGVVVGPKDKRGPDAIRLCGCCKSLIDVVATGHLVAASAEMDTPNTAHGARGARLCGFEAIDQVGGAVGLAGCYVHDIATAANCAELVASNTWFNTSDAVAVVLEGLSSARLTSCARLGGGEQNLS